MFMNVRLFFHHKLMPNGTRKQTKRSFQITHTHTHTMKEEKLHRWYYFHTQTFFLPSLNMYMYAIKLAKAAGRIQNT